MHAPSSVEDIETDDSNILNCMLLYIVKILSTCTLEVFLSREVPIET